MNKLLSAFFIIYICFLVTTNAVEADTAFDKLGRGLSNTFMAFAEVTNAVGEGYAHGDKRAANTWIAFTGGLERMAGRMAIGIYEVFTFPFPDKEDFESRIDTEFAFDSFPDPEIFE